MGMVGIPNMLYWQLIELIWKYESDRMQIVLNTLEYPLCKSFCMENELKSAKIDLY